MPEFRSYLSYLDFAASVTRRYRFTRSQEQAEFLKTVLATSTSKEQVIPTGSIVWRAQKGHVWKRGEIAPGDFEGIPYPYCSKRMKPPRDRAHEGRANSKGIPCLYVATHEETALAEVRPWIGTIVSIAQLKTMRELRVVNCTIDDHRNMIYSQEPDAGKRELAVWQAIDRAFARPLTVDDDMGDYAPTQVLAEAFREHGFDGVGYRSSLGPGHNLVFFELDAADIINRSLREIRGFGKLEHSNVGGTFHEAPV
jgi:hypothetical protein